VIRGVHKEDTRRTLGAEARNIPIVRVISFAPNGMFMYSLRPILLFASTDISRYILVVDTSVLVKSIMGWREYINMPFGAKLVQIAPLRTRWHCLFYQSPLEIFLL
jgi:hypothetical protein